MSPGRTHYAAPALACAALLGFGYYLQYARGLEPCPLCLVQRGFFYAVAAIFGVAALHGPQAPAGRLYALGGFASALGGAAVALRQVWLQHLPPAEVPPCGPDLFYMLENLSLARTLQKLFAGSGQCAEVTWTFLGFSIAEWSLAWFAALALYALRLALSARSRA